MENSKGYLHELTYLMHRDCQGKNKPECFYCDREFNDDADGYSNIAIEHLKSSYDGGEDDVNNYVISCKFCNSAKGNKSFVKPKEGEEEDEKLKEFKTVQRRVRELNDQWVKNLFRYTNLKEYPGEKFYHKLLSALEQDSFFSNVREHKKSDGYWVKFVTRENDDWYFNLIGFILQPHFLFKEINWRDEKVDYSISDDLFKNGYYCDHLMYKYIEPFDDLEVGIALIKKEIRDLYEIYDSIKQKL